MTEHRGPVVARRDALTVIGCKACGFYHLDPLPDAEALAQFYASDFWQHKKAGALETLEAEREWLDAIHGDWLALVMKHGDPITLLDCGCGYGFFVRAAYAHGLMPYGFDQSTAAIDYAMTIHGGRVWRGSWDSCDTTHYDVLSALWLIEHLPDPLAFLRWAHDRLVPDGVLLAVVPNDFTHIQHMANKMVKCPFWWLDVTHLNYFTWSSFSNLLGRAGFRIVERSTLYQMEQYLIDGDDYTDNPALGKNLHAEVRIGDIEMSRDERLKRYQHMARCGRGREIVVVAVSE